MMATKTGRRRVRDWRCFRVLRISAPDLTYRIAGPWRASLEHAETGERIGFSCLAEVCAYLLEQATEEAKACATDSRCEAPQ